MTLNYQMESSHVADYELYTLPGVKFPLRGPQWPLEAATPSISFLGAAQTFGAFSKYPFANLLGEMCSARVMNFGRGGAGPGYYTKQQQIIDYVNKSNCCIVQLMSARSSVENDYMTSIEGLTSVRIKKGALQGREMMGHLAYQELARELSPADFLDLVLETRETYVSQFIALANLITVPKILLFVGKNAPLRDFQSGDNWTMSDLVGIHPHMVSATMVESLSAHFDRTVVVTGPAGFDRRMVNRFSGEYVSIKRSETYTVRKHDVYIPPHLHVNAALQLYAPTCDLLAAA
jgi:hypothetical protein